MPLSLRRLAAALALLLGLGSAPATAGCTGPSLLDRLDADKLAGLRAAVEATPYGEGLLWSAQRGGTRILLAGTMHLPDPRHAVTLAALGPAIRDADLVLLEATAEEQRLMARTLAERPELAVITDGPILSDLLPPEDWSRVAAAADLRGIPPALAARYRPWLLMMALSVPPCALEGGSDGGGGLDHLIQNAADAEGTPTASLEPWDTLFRLMQGGGIAREIAVLKLVLLDPGPAEEMLVAMREGYFSGRIAELWELSRMSADLLPAPAEPGAAEALEDGLLIQRNAAWVPVIEEAAARTPRLLVAAGASHLPGEDGVLRLLERAGWTIEGLDGTPCCEGFWETP